MNRITISNEIWKASDVVGLIIERLSQGTTFQTFDASERMNFYADVVETVHNANFERVVEHWSKTYQTEDWQAIFTMAYMNFDLTLKQL